MPFPEIDPVFLRLGPLQFRWYGLMYVISFIISYFVIRSELRRKKLPIDSEGLADMIFYMALGVVLGGRLGYILFYDLSSYISNPVKMLYIWEGGMSFHGGLIGVASAGFLFARSRGINFMDIADLAAVAAPIGLGLGRIGNFINGELYGRPTSMPWGMVFPEGGGLPRHPSQLYESFLEGVLLYLIVRYISRRVKARGAAAAAFVAGYGLFRSFVELFRQPDSQLGLFYNFISMGQMLSLPLFLAGGCMLVWLWRKQAKAKAAGGGML